jgi:hypothetical protein
LASKWTSTVSGIVRVIKAGTSGAVVISASSAYAGMPENINKIIQFATLFIAIPYFK